MTQQLHDEQVDPWDYPLGVKSDLLSLRAAVRRVHDAEDAVKQTRGLPIEAFLDALRKAEAVSKALRDEMAGIDGGKEQKP